MTAKMWKITGNGFYFSPFYVETYSQEIAKAMALDILNAAQRAENRIVHHPKALSKNIADYIISVNEVNMNPSHPVVSHGQVWKTDAGLWAVFLKGDFSSEPNEYEIRHMTNVNRIRTPERFFENYPRAVKVFSG